MPLLAYLISLNKKKGDEMLQETKSVFRYEYLEDEGQVSIFAKDKLVTTLVDDDGDPEAVFTWFVNIYSKTNMALNYAGVVKWNEPSSVPLVAKGDEQLFWVAVKSIVKNPHGKDKARVLTFLSQYQNRPLEYDEDGELLGDDNLMNTDGDPVSSVGWVTCKSHSEYDDYYELIEFSDNYELLGWADYVAPEFIVEQR